MEPIRITPAEVKNIYDDFAKGKKAQEEIYVEFDNVNSIDTLVLIRVMSQAPDVDTLAPVVEQLLDGHKITFKRGEDEIKSYYYNKGNGNKLHLMFTDAPYFYDILQQSVYALLLKKLTPHLEGSN